MTSNTSHEKLITISSLGPEVIVAILIQVVGFILILSSAVLLARHRRLHKLDHVFHINILVSGAVFLSSNWMLLVPWRGGCEAFSVVFIVSGAAGIFSATGVAIERCRTMLRMATSVTTVKKNIAILTRIWLFSMSTVVYPLGKKVYLTYASSNITNNRAYSICFTDNSLLYSSLDIALILCIAVIIVPVILMFSCYILIFHHVQKARCMRNNNRAVMQRTKTASIVLQNVHHGRKLNVFQIETPSSSTILSTRQRLSEQSEKLRECRILLKCIISVLIILVTWLPLCAMTLCISSVGFNKHHLLTMKYLLLNSQLSVLMNIVFYIIYCERYRQLYINFLLNSFVKLCACSNVTSGNTASSARPSVSMNCPSFLTDRDHSKFTQTASLPPIREQPPYPRSYSVSAIASKRPSSVTYSTRMKHKSLPGFRLKQFNKVNVLN
ncbi:uncharacterized protein LOC127869780 [Dreissena polymorpha]|uniref:uncharacterized protein LOC127869780 n=1 Tax=Dreissena polymorpha TaxID=45954 RepID=UPI002264676C|nr:uncharacterized protein LOC127869780 [Dreissena polymorpha]